MSSPRCFIGQILVEIAFGLQSLLEVLHIKVYKFTKVCPVVSELLYTDRRMDRHESLSKLLS
jgi:hypothetical protein